MNLNENNSIKDTNLNNNKQSYYHQSTTPYKNYQHHNHQHKTPKDKFRPLGFSSPYHQSGNPEISGNCSTPFNNQFRNFKDSNRNNYGNNNRNNHNNYKRNSKNASRDENISQYFHPCMLEDPWKKLEDHSRKLKQNSPEFNSSGADSNPT